MINSEQGYRDLQNEIQRLTVHRDELIALAANERVWQGHAYVHGKPAADVASVFNATALRIEEQIKSLEAQLPCIKFAHLFGWLLYKLYLEKYPINHKTELIEWRVKDIEVVYFSLDAIINIFDFAPGDPPPVRSDRSGSARFEQWATADFSVNLKLAYAPEINTVYWMRL